jgi:hypothetical protein
MNKLVLLVGVILVLLTIRKYWIWKENRKVKGIVPPDNWLNPEERDNKSPFFSEEESELLNAELINEEKK